HSSLHSLSNWSHLDVVSRRMVHAISFNLSRHLLRRPRGDATMPTAGTSSSGNFSCASATQRTLKDLRTKRKGQPVFVDRQGHERAFDVCTVRLAFVKFADGTLLGYDPVELLLPTEIDEKGVAYFEIRQCRKCDQQFPLTAKEFASEQEPSECPDCRQP